ncbi:hypothetical protein [Segnochrobactrum spirostomi]|uniref:Aminoglycoside phosphotransferase domain-containing protein n=1 Tax=Segnochrobactrum spirostomi TaxID=2608987 RepID=A0A6A7Y4Z1_9HYPH|nr:hypothetical protein [Segnochrobactrum spirostomi]MQT13161.1 hypothetical protein [Segnochrobactrum spirostomi]
MADSRTAEIRALVKAGDRDGATGRLAALLADLFGLAASDIVLNDDRYSLNSLNGFFSAGGEPFFFKFHQEEGEEAMRGEYYRVDILAKAGLPIDRPVHVSAEPGEQILIYRRRSEPRFADVLRALDLAPDAALAARAVAAERALNGRLAAIAARTLHPIDAATAAAEPIHRLFHQRLVDLPAGTYPGGRLVSFYRGKTSYPDKTFAFPGVTLDWETLSALRFVVNGVDYATPLGAMFDEAATRLSPERLAGAGLVAHGDAHNANVWFHDDPGAPSLSLFDPAFAGEDVPALLAEVKATFHNVLAHPLWLYDPDVAATRFTARAERRGDRLVVETDWALPAHRQALLDAKAELYWRPLLRDLAARGLLPADWRRVVRLALFCCPTLVMNLRAGADRHNPVSSAIGLSVAVMCGSEPVAGEDVVTRFLAAIDPARG